ncbi:MAG: 2-amino-4-hydroxy-6-hydroxymethyldihydropteridine diphosphokinase [Candidatus Dadabacteria bacterium]|jgi:2-amino-4-hydroxy-6-hydroxymethyldihydropteridine diphosphokinase
MSLNKVVIGVGSNIDPETNINQAKEVIAKAHNLKKVSSFIETEPIGCENQTNFLNGALLIETEMDTPTLKAWLKNLEKELGRIKSENKNGPRTVDLDIIVWNGEVVDNEVYEREFLINSINELLPELKIQRQ